VCLYACAAVANGNAGSDPKRARIYGVVSIVVSIAGIVISVTLFAALYSHYVSGDACPYRYDDICYNHRESYSYYTSCPGEIDGFYCYYN